MSKVHLVIGNTGEYDDYQEWVAAVCGSERTATARAKKLNEITQGHGRTTYYDKEKRNALLDRLRKAGDRAPRMDYNGTTYDVDGPYEVETKA